MVQKTSIRTFRAQNAIIRSAALRVAAPLASAVLFLVSSPTWAASDLYWDSNGGSTAGSSNVGGTWGTSNFWNTASDGITSSSFTTSTSSTNDVHFSAGTNATSGNNITVSGTQAANNIFIEEGTVTLNSGTLQIKTGVNDQSTAGTATINSAVSLTGATGASATLTNSNTSNKAFTITGGITGSPNLILNADGLGALNVTITSINNSGTLTISGAGTGQTTVSGGVGANVGAISISATGPVAFTTTQVNNTGAITNSGAGNFTLSSGVGSNVGNITLSGTGSATQILSTNAIGNNGSITNNAGTNGATTISAAIGSTVTGIVQNSTTSAMTLSGNNSSYTAGITATAGTIKAATNGTAFGTGTVTVGASGIVDINGVAITTGLLSSAATGATVTNSGALKVLNITGDTSKSYSGSITGNISLTMSAGGGVVQTLKGSNSYSGTTIVYGGGELKFDTGSTVAGTNISAAIFSGGVGGSGTIDLNGTATISGGVTLGAFNNTLSTAYTGVVNESGDLTAGGALAVADAINSTGTYNLSGGTASFAGQGRIASGGSSTFGSTGVINQTGGVYTNSFGGGNQLVSNATEPGVLAVDPAFIIGKNGSGTYNLSLGSFSLTNNTSVKTGLLYVGTVSNGNANSSAKFVQTGGSVSVQGLSISPTASKDVDALYGGGSYEISGSSTLTTKSINIAPFGYNVTSGQKQRLLVKGSGSTIQVTGTSNFLSGTDAFSGALTAAAVFFVNTHGSLDEQFNGSTQSEIDLTQPRAAALFNTGSKVSLSLVDGYAPTVTTTYDLLVASSIVTADGLATLMDNGGDTHWGLSIATAGDGRSILRATYAIPEPANLVVFGMTTVGLLRRRRSRKS